MQLWNWRCVVEIKIKADFDDDCGPGKGVWKVQKFSEILGTSMHAVMNSVMDRQGHGRAGAVQIY